MSAEIRRNGYPAGRLSYVKTLVTGNGVAKFFIKTTDSSPDMNVNGSLVAPIEFRVYPAPNTKYHVTGFGIAMADNVNENGIIDHNKILGVPALTNGIISSTRISGVTSYTGLFKRHIDFAVYPNVLIQSDGTATSSWVTYGVTFDVWGGTPLVLDSRNGDYMSFVIQDNLTGLEYFRILTNGVEEPILKWY
jgi:hypothetical protein